MYSSNVEKNTEEQELEYILRFVLENLGKCIQCGKCVGICPAAETSDFNSRKIIHSLNTEAIEGVLKSNNIWRCVLCSGCYAVCPNNINFPLSLMLLRVISFYYGFGWELDRIAIPYVEHYLKTGMVLPDGESEEITAIFKSNSGTNGTISEIRGKIGLEPKRIVSQKAMEEISRLAEISGLVKKMEIIKSHDPQNTDDLPELHWGQECKEILHLLERLPGGK